MRRQLRTSIARMEAKGLDEETRSDLAKLVCVRVSGHVERAFRELTSAFAYGRSDPRVAEYVASKVARTSNLGGNELIAVLKTFDQKWATAMEQFFDADPDAKDALDSIVAGRHRIAHGHDHGVSPNTVKAWFVAVDRVVAKLEEIVDPPS